MADAQIGVTEDSRHRPHEEHVADRLSDVPQYSPETDAMHPLAVRSLATGVLSGRSNLVMRSQALQSMQHTYGNAATLRATQRGVSGPGSTSPMPIQRSISRSSNAPVQVQRDEDDDDTSWWDQFTGKSNDSQDGDSGIAGLSGTTSIYPGMSPLTVGLPIGKVAPVDQDPTSQAYIGVAKKAVNGLEALGNGFSYAVNHPLSTLKRVGSGIWDFWKGK